MQSRKHALQHQALYLLPDPLALHTCIMVNTAFQNYELFLLLCYVKETAKTMQQQQIPCLTPSGNSKQCINW